MKPTGPTNPVLRELIRVLRKASVKNKAPVWRALADELERPRRIKKPVNVGKLERYCNEGEIVVVAGKLLGGGNLTKKLVVASLDASPSAIKKVEEAGGKWLPIRDLLEQNPNGSGVRLMKG